MKYEKKMLLKDKLHKNVYETEEDLKLCTSMKMYEGIRTIKGQLCVSVVWSC